MPPNENENLVIAIERLRLSFDSLASTGLPPHPAAVQSAISVAEVSFAFFATVILLSQWNYCIAWGQGARNRHYVLRPAAHLPGFFFFLNVLMFNLSLTREPSLIDPIAAAAAVMFAVITLLLQAGSFMWMGFLAGRLGMDI